MAVTSASHTVPSLTPTPPKEVPKWWAWQHTAVAICSGLHHRCGVNSNFRFVPPDVVKYILELARARRHAFVGFGDCHPTEVWDITTGELSCILPYSSTWLCTSSGAGDVLYGATGRSVWAWETSRGRAVPGFRCRCEETIYCVANLEGRLITGGAQGRLRMHDAATGALIAENGTHHYPFIKCIEPITNGIIATGSGDGQLRLWDTRNLSSWQEANGIPAAFTLFKGSITAMKPCSTNHNLFCGLSTGALNLIDVETGNKLEDITFTSHNDSVGAIDTCDATHLLASGGFDSMVFLWDQRNASRVATVTAHEGWVRGVQISEETSLVTSVDALGIMFVSDIRTMKPLHKARVSNKRGAAALLLGW